MAPFLKIYLLKNCNFSFFFFCINFTNLIFISYIIALVVYLDGFKKVNLVAPLTGATRIFVATLIQIVKPIGATLINRIFTLY